MLRKLFVSDPQGGIHPVADLLEGRRVTFIIFASHICRFGGITLLLEGALGVSWFLAGARQPDGEKQDTRGMPEE